jgi:hypothetical protein
MFQQLERANSQRTTGSQAHLYAIQPCECCICCSLLALTLWVATLFSIDAHLWLASLLPHHKGALLFVQ